MSFFTELKKRNVFKVGAAYAVVAWLLVQAADVFFPALHLPDWGITLVAGLVLLGFPVALLLAWAYEITPGGIIHASQADASVASAQVPGQRFNYLILGLVALAVLVLLIDRYALNQRATDQREARGPDTGSATVIAAAVMLPEAMPLGWGAATIGFESPLIALSPDSSLLVYVGLVDGQSQLFRHRLDGFDTPEAIPGTENAKFPFFSPDGRSIGFLTIERLKHVPFDGDNVQTIASVTAPTRAKWVDEDFIYVIDDQGNSLRRIEVKSGNIESLVEDSNLYISDVHPGEQFALGMQKDTSIGGDFSEIMRIDLAAGKFEQLGVSGFDARWISDGQLIFGRNGSVFTVEVDPKTVELTGEPRLAMPNVAMDSIFSQVQLTLSASGTLAFVPGVDRAIGQIVAVEGDGTEHMLAQTPQKFGVLDLSSDDRFLAVQMTDVNDYVWIYDLVQGEGKKLAGSDGFGWPKYSKSGALALSDATQATADIRVMVINGDGSTPKFVFESQELEGVISDWSPDGDVLVLSEWNTSRVGLIESEGQGEIKWLSNEVSGWGGVFSPDGKWLAYSSHETGRYEIWIKSLEEHGKRRQLSANGGIEPVWCPCGKVFFRRGMQFWSVAVETESELAFGAKELEFSVTDFLDTPGRSYDVSSDGQVLYAIKRAQPAVLDRVHIVANWLNSLE